MTCLARRAFSLLFHGGQRRIACPQEGQNSFFNKKGLNGCILQFVKAFYFARRLIFVAKFQKINLIGCHLLLKSVNFFIFNFQNLNIQGFYQPPILGTWRGTMAQNPKNWQMFTSVYIVWSDFQVGVPLQREHRTNGFEYRSARPVKKRSRWGVKLPVP